MEEANAVDVKSCLLTDFLSMCRLCLSKSNVKVDIFDENESTSLAFRIMACAALEVTSSDQLPKRICDECRYQLEKSYVFRKRCKNSDTKLRRYFRQLNAGKISQMFENSDDEDEYADSQDFFNTRQQEKMQQIEKEREDRERDFQQRMKNFMEEERCRFHEEETKRIMDEHKILAEEKRVVMHMNISCGSSKNESQSVCKSEIDVLPVTEVEEDQNNELFDEEEEEYDEETEEQENPEQNDDEIEFILNEETEENMISSETNADENVKYDQNDEEDERDSDDDDIKVFETKISKDPLLLNSNLKPSNSMGEDQFVFSLKADKSNQYIIKPGPSKTPTEADEESALDSDSKNVIDKTGPTEDIDFDHLTTAVRSILAQQVGLNVNGDVNFKVLKRRENIAKVEVRTTDGTIIVMEVELDTMLKDNNGELKIFGCSQCPRAFSRKAQLQRHASTHVKEKGMSCEYCEKWFPSKSGLDRHIRVHTGEKPFKCDICGKCFIQKEILKRHTMVHTGERPFKCLYCEKSFIQNDMLRFHINRKHSDNPVVELRKCPLCSKTFSYASGLSRHLTVHTGKIFPCTYCSKKFNDRSAHKRHVTTVHRILNS